jgi:hypothetical protein
VGLSACGGLEEKFEAELDLSCGGSGGDDSGGGAEGNGGGLVGGGALGGTGGEDGLGGGEQVGVVEDVEELGAELCADAFGELRGLGEGQVEVVVGGAGEGVAAEVADRAVGGRGEGGWVEVLGYALGCGSFGVE